MMLIWNIALAAMQCVRRYIDAWLLYMLVVNARHYRIASEALR